MYNTNYFYLTILITKQRPRLSSRTANVRKGSVDEATYFLPLNSPRVIWTKKSNQDSTHRHLPFDKQIVHKLTTNCNFAAAAIVQKKITRQQNNKTSNRGGEEHKK